MKYHEGQLFLDSVPIDWRQESGLSMKFHGGQLFLDSVPIDWKQESG